MRNLPSGLQRYLWVVYGWAIGVLFFSFYTKPNWSDNFLILIFFSVLTIITEFRPVSYNKTITQTTVTAILVSSLFLFPPFSVALIAVVGSVFSELILRKPWYKLWFNTAQRIISIGSASLLLYAFNIDSFVFDGIGDILKIVSVFLVYTILMNVLMGAVVALAKEQKFISAWRESIAFFNAYDFSLFPYGLVLAWLWHSNPWYFFFGLIPLAAIQRSFAVHAKLLNEQEATARLASQQRQIQEATTSLLSSKEIHVQLDTLLKHMMDVFPVMHASVLLWSETGAPDQVVSRGICTPELPIESWSTNLRKVSEARRIVQLDHEFVTRVMGGRPVILVPLVTPDDTVGCLVLVAEDNFELDEQGRRLIETFAAQAALAIYQARLIGKLQTSQVQIVQSERLAAIGTLAAGVAHEFNNLLAGISGIAQLALLEDTREEQREALSTVAKAAQQGGSITRGLLTFARHLEPKRELADVRGAIEPVLSMLQAEFRRSHIEVHQRITPVPLIICDVGMLSQVMMNLCTNAIDAMQPYGGTLTVSLDEYDRHIRLIVSDTGVGIPDHVRDRIFEPFVSTKTSSDGKLHGGTGLGLAISYGIITDHGGTIEVQSSPAGTMMTVLLPMNVHQAGVNGSSLAVTRHPLRMIIVDDEPLIAKSLHGMLTLEGHDAEWFTEPHKALEAISQAPVDVIFADLMMPEMDGVTLLQYAKQCVPGAAQIVVTGQVELRQLERVQALGVNAVIEKPFSLDDVRAIVNSVRAA